MKNLLVAVALSTAMSVSAFATDAKVAGSANNEFGLKLFQKTSKTTGKGNKFLSPTSAYLALSMLLNGATGETADQLIEGLALEGQSMDDINQANENLHLTLTESTDFDLSVANSVWAKKGLTIKSDFARAVKKHYEASVNTLDFDDPSASKVINAWVTHHTKGKIDSIVPEKLPADLVMFLANAIYFDAKWAMPFAKHKSRKIAFRGKNGTEEVPMMSNTAPFRYVALRGGEGVELTYGKKNDASMILWKPAGQDLDTFVSNLDAQGLENLVNEVRSAPLARGTVTMPSLELNYKDTLNGTLKSMGMTRMFASNAQLENLFDAGPRTEVSSVVQKTYLKVYEEGTIAAAVTGIGVSITSVPPPPKFNFVADAPYLLMIRDNRSGAILFMGAIAMPEGGKLPTP